MYRLLINPEDEIKSLYEPFLFNRNEYRKQTEMDYSSFYLWNEKKKMAAGEVHFVVREGRAESPYRASFGSFQLAPGLKAETINTFINDVESELKKSSVQFIKIRNYPFCYDPSSGSLLSNLLVSNGYSLDLVDCNFHIPVSDNNSFYNSLRQSEKARINAAVNGGIQAGLNLKPDLNEVYKVLLKSRTDKGYPLRISFADFAKMFECLPGHYFVFEARLNNKLIAVAVNIRISSKIFYNFHLGQLSEFKKSSPGVLLLKEIYSFCVQNKFELFDLGIGTDGGEFNFPLINFKQNMGGIASIKPAFTKQLV